MRVKTSRFILPGHKTESYQNSLPWDSMQMLRDFDKVFAMLDGKRQPEESLEYLFQNNFHSMRVNKRMSSSYFDVRFYPGGRYATLLPEQQKTG